MCACTLKVSFRRQNIESALAKHEKSLPHCIHCSLVQLVNLFMQTQSIFSRTLFVKCNGNGQCECLRNLSDLYPSYAEDNLGITEERKSQSIHVLGWKISGPILSHCAFRACYCYSLDQVFYNAEKLLGIQCQLTQW